MINLFGHQETIYSECPLIPALSLSKCCRVKGYFAGIRVNSVSVTKIHVGMYPYPGKNSGKKCQDKGYFAGIMVCRDKGTPTVLQQFLPFLLLEEENITGLKILSLTNRTRK